MVSALRPMFPTNTDDQFGRGKYILAPLIAGVYYPESLPPGSFVGVMVRDEFSYAGDEDRADFHNLGHSTII